MFHEDPGKQPYSLDHRRALGRLAVDPDPLHTAAGGFAFKNKAAQIFVFQFLHPVFGPFYQAFGVIELGAHGHQTGGLRVPYQTHGFPGHPQPAFYFGADGNKFHIASKSIGDKAV